MYDDVGQLTATDDNWFLRMRRRRVSVSIDIRVLDILIPMSYRVLPW
jgi:hypothetical protein